MSLDGLPAYIRAHNQTGRSKLHVIAPKKGRPLSCPVVLRFVIPDVVAIYLTLERSATEEQALVVESATAFGPREQVRAGIIDWSMKGRLTAPRVLEGHTFAVRLHRVSAALSAAGTSAAV